MGSTRLQGTPTQDNFSNMFNLDRDGHLRDFTLGFELVWWIGRLAPSALPFVAHTLLKHTRCSEERDGGKSARKALRETGCLAGIDEFFLKMGDEDALYSFISGTELIPEIDQGFVAIRVFKGRKLLGVAKDLTGAGNCWRE